MTFQPQPLRLHYEPPTTLTTRIRRQLSKTFAKKRKTPGT